MHRFLKQLVPFILIGIAVVAFFFGIMLLAYLFFFGATLGFLLFIITWIKEKLFPPKTPSVHKKHTGRIIDSDDWRKL